MTTIRTEQLYIDNALRKNFDIILTSSGYEQRSSFLIKSYGFDAQFKYCLCFPSKRTFYSRFENDAFFISSGFIMIKDITNKARDLEPVFNKITSLIQKKSRISILVDISSMTRIWYASLLLFCHSQKEYSLIEIVFSYSQSHFLSPQLQETYITDIEPITGFYSLTIPNKPTALIIGLGYIEKQAFGLAEYFDAIPYLFISRNANSDSFYQEVLSTNSRLLKGISDDNIFTYTLDDLASSESLLYQVCKDLNTSYRVVLAPCGPKPFTLLCLITSLRNKSIDVWRISAKSDDEVIDKVANGSLYILQYTQELS